MRWSTFKTRSFLQIIRILILVVSVFCFFPVKSQVLFAEECFTGGVLTGGADTSGSIENVLCQIDWQPDYTLKAAYAVTYRYGRPAPFAIRINGSDVLWSLDNQAGPEQIEENDLSQFFAPHVVNITEVISINSDVLTIDFPIQPGAGNMGWWGVYVVVLFESPDISSDVCFRLYIADQNQMAVQNYSFNTSGADLSQPVVLGLHSGRMASWEPDRSLIFVNSIFIGEIWQGDLVSPPAFSGVQGHFSYKNSSVLAFNGDTANTTVNKHDGTAIINTYLNSGPQQSLRLQPNLIPPQFNPNPSFILAYTPTCTTLAGTMPRSLTYCRDDTSQAARQLQAIPGYDHYAWTPGAQLSDSNMANPTCFADSSRWYRARMWSDDGELCPQTIPVFVEVGQVPRPDILAVSQSSCPNPTGRVRMEDMRGKAPFSYVLGETVQDTGLFQQMAPGTYPVQITDALGCTWDTTVVVPLNAPQTAAFVANPEEGDSPLVVDLINQSTNPTPSPLNYQWLIDGLPFSTAEHTNYTFADTGTYTISLVAWVGNAACGDTASISIRVNPGIRLLVPNIITPNGDGRNDQLVAQVFGVAELRWQVFNRWGNLLHSGERSAIDANVELWDGGDAPDGTYPVVLTAIGLNGKTERWDVVVTVVR